MISEDTLRALVIALLSGGGATFIWTVVRSFIAYKDSAEGREDKAVARLEKYEQDARAQLRCERIWGSHWYRVAAVYEHALLQHGIPLPATPPEPSRHQVKDVES